ncbi:hypothetical protein JW796_02340 [Candidatus Dojkabacteria bacterium]|nr:hypothetical protein [Candidatus Dojkabacteria bacterium]
MKNFIKKHFILILAIAYLIWPLDLLPGLLFDDLIAILTAAIIELVRDKLLGKEKKDGQVIEGEVAKKDSETEE